MKVGSILYILALLVTVILTTIVWVRCGQGVALIPPTAALTVLLTIIAWVHGWRGWALIPPAAMFIVQLFICLVVMRVVPMVVSPSDMGFIVVIVCPLICLAAPPIAWLALIIMAIMGKRRNRPPAEAS